MYQDKRLYVNITRIFLLSNFTSICWAVVIKTKYYKNCGIYDFRFSKDSHNHTLSLLSYEKFILAAVSYFNCLTVRQTQED